MPGLTNKVRDALLRGLTGDPDAILALPLDWSPTWISLLTVAPSDDGGPETDPTGAVDWSLARISSITSALDVSAEPEHGGRQLANVAQFSWGVFDTQNLTQDTTVVGGALYSKSTGSEILAWDYLPSPVTVIPGTEIIFPPGKFRIRMHKEI